MLLIFVEVVFSLLEVIETVIGRLCRFGGCCFPVLTAFLVFGIQSMDVIDRMYIFLFPAFQNLVCILEAGLTCLKDSTVAGFLDDLHGKAIGSKPGVHQCDLCLYGIAVGDSESLENRKLVFIISGAGLLGFFHRGKPLLSPGKSHLLDVADALVIVAHAIFNQIFDQVSRHAKAIIEEKHLLNFCR